MATQPAVPPKLRQFPIRQLIDKVDPDAKSMIFLEYSFSNGRKFKRNLGHNRTA